MKKGILATTTIYICIYHNDFILKKYFKELARVFKVISMSEKGNLNIYNELETEISYNKFERLN